MFTRLFILLFSLSVLTACGSSRANTASRQNDNGYLATDQRNESGSVSTLENLDRNRTLADHLATIPGISLSNGLLVVRGGATSFRGISEPLYVLDGNPISGGFAAVNGMVKVLDIDRVTVLKGSSATIYGTRGQNGVIVIKTKRSS